MRLFSFLLILLVISACSDDDGLVSDFTGNEMVYNLVSDPQYYNGDGTVTFKERVDEGVTIEIDMEPTGSGGFHPTHLHYGTYDIPDAAMAAMLTPVDATTGSSTTTIYQLLDASKITYTDILSFDGSIKVHLDDGANSKIVLTATNVGLNASMDISDIATCSSGKEPS